MIIYVDWDIKLSAANVRSDWLHCVAPCQLYTCQPSITITSN